MRTVVLGPRPSELEALIERRRRMGLDTFDEMWDGEYHMAPAPSGRHGLVDAELLRILWPLADAGGLNPTTAFNLGTSENDFRVPDHGLHRGMPLGAWIPTAALVVEIVSPNDESWAKLGFYAERGVDEVVVVDPDERSVVWMARAGEGYEPVERSAVLDVDVADVADEIRWP